MRDTWFCKCCFRQSSVEHDGVNGFCVGCQTPVVRNPNNIFDAAWYPLAEFAVGAVSRPAGLALKALDRAEDTASPNWQPILNLAAFAIMATIGGIVLRELFADS